MIDGARWLIRIIAAGSAVLFLTSLNPLGVILAPELLNHVSVVALIAIPLALVVDVVAPPAKRRLWPIVRLLIGLPATLFALLLGSLASPGVINRVTLPDGQQYLLGIGATPTDVDYQLWKSVGPRGFFWRKAEDLTWSEDGGFTEDPQLILVNERWLMVRRGGIWTDCYEVTATRLEPCGGINEMPDWQSPGSWRVASARMAREVGAEPDAS